MSLVIDRRQAENGHRVIPAWESTESGKRQLHVFAAYSQDYMAADTFKLCLRIYNNGTFSHNRLISYQHCQSSDCQHLRLSSSSIHIISDNGWKCSKVYKQSEVITVKKLSITKNWTGKGYMTQPQILLTGSQCYLLQKQTILCTQP